MDEREQVVIEIAKILDTNNGKLFMGMVHQIYGPLRGLNFLIENPDIESVLSLLDIQSKGMEMDDQIRLLDEIKKGKKVKDIHDLTVKIWSETALASNLMILPVELIDQAENYPNTVNSLDEGISEIAKSLSFTSILQKQDPYFFRTGII